MIRLNNVRIAIFLLVVVPICFASILYRYIENKNNENRGYVVSLFENGKAVITSKEADEEIFNYFLNKFENEENYLCNCFLSLDNLKDGKAVNISLINDAFNVKIDNSTSNSEKVYYYQKEDHISIDLEEMRTDSSIVISYDDVEFLEKYFK